MINVGGGRGRGGQRDAEGGEDAGRGQRERRVSVTRGGESATREGRGFRERGARVSGRGERDGERAEGFARGGRGFRPEEGFARGGFRRCGEGRARRREGREFRERGARVSAGGGFRERRVSATGGESAMERGKGFARGERRERGASGEGERTRMPSFLGEGFGREGAKTGITVSWDELSPPRIPICILIPITVLIPPYPRPILMPNMGLNQPPSFVQLPLTCTAAMKSWRRRRNPAMAGRPSLLPISGGNNIPIRRQLNDVRGPSLHVAIHICSSTSLLLSVFIAAVAAAATAALAQPAAAGRQPLNNATDLAALRAFQSSADTWNVLSVSWNDSAEFCGNWRGIACSRRRQRVTQLSLPGASLAGAIPPELGNLSFLVSLNLSSNSLTGPIPGSALARLHHLRFVDLSHNSLSGSVPSELGSLHDLRTLDLRDNQLTGTIPGSLGRLSSLEILRLGDNLGIIGDIPPELGSLSNLRSLRLQNTNLTGDIPPELGNLANLEEFYIIDTMIGGEFPIELGNLTKLKVLNLASNFLEGRFPAAVYSMSALEQLILADNILEGPLPRDLGHRLPRSLKELYINVNNITGTIPSSLSNASMLSVLELSYNLLEGSIPTELGALQELTHLTVVDNQLSGPLDFLGALTNCRKLQQLNLLDNKFTGSLPASAIANFTKTDLFRLVVQGNQLTGSIPATFGNLTNMQTLVMSYNMLSGAIPPGLLALPNMQRLYLEANRLEGPIPPEIGLGKTLGLLYLQDNHLSGPIPDSIGNLTDLAELDLGQNKLESTLPRGLWQLRKLFNLNLAVNRLEGQLPEAITQLEGLTNLNFSSNRFSGGIPFTIGKLQKLEHLSLANNTLSGALPPSLGNLTGLKVLDLSSNSLTSGIPSSFEQLSHLENLNLSFNMLEGQVPVDGIFANVSTTGISNTSFVGNSALCGALRFNLPACKKARSLRRPYVVMASVASALLFSASITFLVDFLVLRRRKQKKNKSTDPPSSADMVVGHPLISLHELMTATDNFDDANLLGAGSFGKVYKGTLADGTMVAVKVLDVHMGEAAWRSFDAECRVMRTVRHRNLIGIITSCSNLDFRALVLPFMANGSLERWIHPRDDGGPCLSLQQRLEVAVDVAVALEYLHHGCSEPVVHRDLKPSNVLLDDAMVAHIADFGISKVMVEHSASSASTSTPGTFGYMAPEYGQVGRVTTKGDVYSYGILLLETFTGKRPTDSRFNGDENLRSWVASAMPSGVAGVLDDGLLQDEQAGELTSSSSGGGGVHVSSSSYNSSEPGNADDVGSSEREQQRLGCVAAVLEVGVLCCSQYPKQRPDMVEVAGKLKKIQSSLDAIDVHKK